MKRILCAVFAVFLGVLFSWGCVDKKADGSGLPSPQVGVATDTAGAVKPKKDLPAAEINMPESLKAGESPQGGTVPPSADSAQQAPAPVSPPSYEPKVEKKKLELLDFDDKKGGKGKKGNDAGKKKSKPASPSPPARPAEYSAPATVVPQRQSAPLPAAGGSVLSAGQLSSWQTLIRDVTEKTSVPAAVTKIIPRKGKGANAACSDAAQALLFSYKYLILHGDEANAQKWYNKYKTFSCADGSALLATLIAADSRFASFVTK